MKKYIVISAIFLGYVAYLGVSNIGKPVKVVVKQAKAKVQFVEEKIKSEKVYTLKHIADKEDVRKVAAKYATKYNVNPEGFICMTMKESGLSGKRPNTAFKCGDSGASCGLTQIQCPTWQSMRKLMGRDTDCAYIFDDYENLETAAFGVSTHWPLHWTGYRLCVDEGYQF